MFSQVDQSMYSTAATDGFYQAAIASTYQIQRTKWLCAASPTDDLL